MNLPEFLAAVEDAHKTRDRAVANADDVFTSTMSDIHESFYGGLIAQNVVLQETTEEDVPDIDFQPYKKGRR